MKPIQPEPREGFVVVKIAEHQLQYRVLPSNINRMYVETRWKLTWMERIQMFLFGEFHLTVLTFGKPLQPLKPTATRQETIG